MQLYYHFINGIGTILAEPECINPLKNQGMQRKAKLWTKQDLELLHHLFKRRQRPMENAKITPLRKNMKQTMVGLSLPANLRMQEEMTSSCAGEV